MVEAAQRGVGGDQVQTRHGGGLDQLADLDILAEDGLGRIAAFKIGGEEPARRRLRVEIPEQGAPFRYARRRPGEVDRKGGFANAPLEAVDGDGRQCRFLCHGRGSYGFPPSKQGLKSAACYMGVTSG